MIDCVLIPLRSPINLSKKFLSRRFRQKKHKKMNLFVLR